MAKNQDKEILRRIEAIEVSVTELQSSLNETTEIAKNKIVIDEVSAKQALDKAIALSKNAEENSQRANATLEQAMESLKIYKDNRALLNNSVKKAEDLNEKYALITENNAKLLSSQTSIQELQTQANASLLTAQKATDQIKIHEMASTNTLAKINDLLSKSANFKTEIENLYDKVMGYDYENDDGETQHEDGLKEQLENSYKALSTSISNQEKNVKQFVESSKESLERLKKSYDDILHEKGKKIDELLPGALTVGLSKAYADKKTEEIEQLKLYRGSFKWSIGCLVAVSTLPLLSNFYLYYFGGKEFSEIINSLPKFLTFVIPLYLPFFWMAWNANKEMKLSRRLIEEYAHKEVLSCTYQGLSQQVKDLKNEEMSSQLENHLLYNMISASSENPGKLITDYNKTDNPLLEILDKSIALSNSVEKFARMPIIGKAFIPLYERLQKKAKEAEQKVVDAANVQRQLESK